MSGVSDRTGREDRVAGEQDLRSIAESHEIAGAACRMARCGNHFHVVGVDVLAGAHWRIYVRVFLDRIQFCCRGV